QKARLAIAECDRIDELAEVDNKMAALASYARQLRDRELENCALRIKNRAARRTGELLLEIARASGRQPKNGGALPRFTRTQAARDGGLSIHQQRTALGIARIPEVVFEGHVESEHPPGTSALVRITRKPEKSEPRREMTDIVANEPRPFLTAREEISR